MGFQEFVWEHIRAQPGLEDTPKKKIKESWRYMVLVYNTDRDAPASTGAAGHDTYFKTPGKHKGDVLAKWH